MTTAIGDDSAALASMLQKWGPERFRTSVEAAIGELQGGGLAPDIALIAYLHLCFRHGVDPEPIPKCLTEQRGGVRVVGAREVL